MSLQQLKLQQKLEQIDRIGIPWGESGDRRVSVEFVKNCHKWRINDQRFKTKPSCLYCKNAKELKQMIKRMT